jgi:hypothetical protein
MRYILLDEARQAGSVVCRRPRGLFNAPIDHLRLTLGDEP